MSLDHGNNDEADTLKLDNENDEEPDILIILPFSFSFETLKPTPQRLGRRPHDGWRLARKTKKLNKKTKRMTSIDLFFLLDQRECNIGLPRADFMYVCKKNARSC